MQSIPPLHPKPPGPALRALGVVVPGIRRVSGQIRPYTRWWDRQNQEAVTAEGPLLTVIGDSTAIGIGASAPDRGYVGLLRQALSERDGVRWRVINLAQSGARVADGVERQLPILRQLEDSLGTPNAALCLIGTNDVVWTGDTPELRDDLKTLISGLPDTAIVGPVAGASPRARAANRAIRSTAGERDLAVVDPWREPGPPPTRRVAEDRFHPSDLGYVLMTRPFARHLAAPLPPIVDQPPDGLQE